MQRLFFPVLVMLFLLVACADNGEQGGGGWPTPEVQVEIAAPTDVALVETYAARIAGAREVEVRARTQGILEQRLYREGESVAEGDTLFRIDPAPARAALQHAEAQRQVAEANVKRAQREAKRIQSLFQRSAVSERERDAAQSELDLAHANLAVAEAGLVQAQLDLTYTQVKAPLSGVTGLQSVPDGSLVQQGTLLTTIIERDPVHVRFAFPEQDAIQLRQSHGANTRLPVQLVDANAQGYDETGYLDFIASGVDSRTGSVAARAVFPNPEHALLPGQFVRVKVSLAQLTDVITVPVTAVMQGPAGAFVYAVDDANVAQAKTLKLGPLVAERQVILAGVVSGERIVVNGQVGVAPGAEVKVVDQAGQGAN